MSENDFRCTECGEEFSNFTRLLVHMGEKGHMNAEAPDGARITAAPDGPNLRVEETGPQTPDFGDIGASVDSVMEQAANRIARERIENMPHVYVVASAKVPLGEAQQVRSALTIALNESACPFHDQHVSMSLADMPEDEEDEPEGIFDEVSEEDLRNAFAHQQEREKALAMRVQLETIIGLLERVETGEIYRSDPIVSDTITEAKEVLDSH